MRTAALVTLTPVVLAMSVVLAAGTAAAQTPVQGNVEAGKTAWATALRCANCHGPQGAGAYGPDLAGRALTFDQFRQAVRHPWGVMPAYTDRQMPDQTLADMYSFLGSLPKPKEVGHAEYATSPGAPIGQVYLVETAGCANCHEPELRQPRKVLGSQATDVDFDFFAKLIYTHTDTYPTGRMGNFSRNRLPEPLLRELYRFIHDDLGLLPLVTATIDAGTTAGGNTTYTLTIKNGGMKGKGLAAEDATISLMLPPGMKVVSATGAGYEGVKPGIEGDHDTKGNAAIWKMARIAPQDELKYTITLPGPAMPPNGLFKDSMVGWTKPAIRVGVPNLQLRDQRMGKSYDYITLTFPATPAPPIPAQSASGAVTAPR